MKSKKLISFLCAAAMTVSSFAGLAVTTASAAQTELWSNDFNAMGTGLIIDGVTDNAKTNSDIVPGLTFVTTNRGDGDKGTYQTNDGVTHLNGSYYAIEEKADGDNYLLMSLPVFGDFGTNGRWAHVDFENTYTPTAEDDLILDFDAQFVDGAEKGDTTDRAKSNPILRLGTFDATAKSANAVVIDKDALNLGDDWTHIRVIVSNTSGAKVYVDGEEKAAAAAAAVKSIATIGLYTGGNLAATTDRQNEFADPSLGRTATPIVNVDNFVVYKETAGTATGTSTAPGAQSQGGATIPPTVTEAPVPAAPVLTVPEDADPQVTFDFEKYSLSNSYYMQESEQNITDIEGMNIHFGSKAESSTRAEIVKTAGGNAFQLASGRFCTGARGPRVSFTNPMEVDNNYTVIGFAFKLSAMKNHEEDAKPRLYLIKDEQQTGDDGAGGYRNIAAVLTAVPGETIERNPGESKVDVISKEVTADEWHYAALVVDGTTHRLYVDYDPTAEKLEPDVKADYVATGGNASPMTALPMLVGDIQAPKVSGAETTPAYANVMLDNIVTYQMTGSEPRRALPGIGEAEEQSTPEPTATPEPVKVHKVTVSNNKQVVSYNDADTETEDPYNAVLIHAAYDTNGRLASVKSYDLKGVAKTVKTVTIPATDPLHKNDKLMVWDSVKGMVPYGKYVVTDGEAQVTPAPTTTPTPTPGAATPTPGTATPTPGTATPTPGTATPTPGTATPDPNVKAATLGKSAYATRGTDDASKKVVVNDGSKAAENLVSNYPSGANKGAYQGVAVIEFEIPKVDDINKIIGATLTLNLENPSTNSNARAYSVYESNTDTPLATGTTYDEIMAKSNGALIYNGANINKGATREDVISNTELLNYVKSKASTTEAKTIQIVVSNSAQGVNVLMSADKAPKLEIETTDKTVYNVPVTYKYGAAGTVYTPAEGDKRPTTVNVIDGDSAAATDEMKAAIVVDGVKYVFDEANTANVLTYKPTAAANTGLVLNFKEAAKHTIKLQTKVGEAAAADYQTVADVPEGDKVTVYYPKYLTDAQGKVTAECSETDYQKAVTSSAIETENTVVVNYTAVTKDMYFVELEDVDGYAKATGENQFSSKMSKGYGADLKDAAADANAAPAFTVPASGKYNVTAVAINKNTRKDKAAVAIYKNDASVAANKLVETIVTASCNAPATVTTTAAVDLAANEKIILLDAGPTTDDNNNRMIVDYVLLEKTAASTATPAPTAEPTAEPTATPAPTFDDPTVATGNDANGTYTATAAPYTAGTVAGIDKTAKVTVANAADKTVGWSKNGAGTWGNWVGFTVAVGEGYEITGIAKASANTSVPTTLETPGTNDKGDSKSLVGYYVDASKEVTDKYFFVKVKKGTEEKVYCYEIDITGVTAKESQKTSTLAGAPVNADTDTTFATSVGKSLADLVGGTYTVNVDDANKTITVTGDLKYVEDYSEMFGSDEASGTYIPLKITRLMDNAVVYVEGAHATGSAPAGVTGVDNKKFNKADKNNFDILKADDNTLYIVFRYAAPAEGEFAKTIIIDQDGDEAGYTPTVYTLKFNGTAQTGNPVAAKPNEEETVGGNSSNVVGAKEDLPENATVKDLGSVALTVDSKVVTPPKEHYIYYKATGNANKVGKEEGTKSNYAAVDLKAPTDDVDYVAIKALASADAADVDSFATTDLKKLGAEKDVTAVLEITNSDKKAYQIAYFKDATASLDSLDETTYEQVGDTIVIDFSTVTLNNATLTRVTSGTPGEGEVQIALKAPTDATSSSTGELAGEFGSYTFDFAAKKVTGVAYNHAYNGTPMPAKDWYMPIIITANAANTNAKIKAEYAYKEDISGATGKYGMDAEQAIPFNRELCLKPIDSLWGTADESWKEKAGTIKTITFTIDADGADGATYDPVEYVLDVSGITLLGAMPADNISAAPIAAGNGTVNVEPAADSTGFTKVYNLTATGLKKHKNEDNDPAGEGYWVGVKVKLPNNIDTVADKVKAYWWDNVAPEAHWMTGAGGFPLTGEIITEADGKYAKFYVDMNKEKTKTYYLAFSSGEKYKVVFNATYAAEKPAAPTISTEANKTAENGQIVISLKTGALDSGAPEDAWVNTEKLNSLNMTDKGVISGTVYNNSLHRTGGNPGHWVTLNIAAGSDIQGTAKYKILCPVDGTTEPQASAWETANEYTIGTGSFEALCAEKKPGNEYQTETVQLRKKAWIEVSYDGETYSDPVLIDWSAADFTYDITKGTVNNGTIKVGVGSKEAATNDLTAAFRNAKANDKIYVVLEAGAGYKVPEDNAVTIAGAEGVTATKDPSDNTTYTFTMPAKNVTVNATFEEEGPTVLKYLIGSADAPDDMSVTTKEPSGSTDWVIYGSQNTSEAKTGGEAGYTKYMGLSNTGGTSFYIGKVFDAVQNGIIELEFDYKPLDEKTFSIELSSGDVSGNRDHGLSVGGSLAENIMTLGTNGSVALTKDQWNHVKAVVDLDLGTISYSVGANNGTPATITNLQKNDLPASLPFKRIRILSSETATANITNMTIKTIQRIGTLDNKKLTVTSANPELGKAYIENEQTTEKSVAQSSSITATAAGNDDNIRFDGWKTSRDSNASVISKDTTITRRMYADETLTASFTQLYTVTIPEFTDQTHEDAVMGTVTADVQKAAAGETVTLTLADQGQYMYKDGTLKVKYNDSDVITPTASELGDGKYTFAMPAANVTIEAEFERDETDYKVSTEVDGSTGGSVSVEPSGATTDGVKLRTQVTVTTSPEAGKGVASIVATYGEEDTEVKVTKSEENKYTFEMPAGNVKVTVKFDDLANIPVKVYDFEDGVNPFENTSGTTPNARISFAAQDDETLKSKVMRVYGNNVGQRSSCFLDFSDIVGETGASKIEFDMKFDNKSRAWITFGTKAVRYEASKTQGTGTSSFVKTGGITSVCMSGDDQFCLNHDNTSLSIAKAITNFNSGTNPGWMHVVIKDDGDGTATVTVKSIGAAEDDTTTKEPGKLDATIGETVKIIDCMDMVFTKSQAGVSLDNIAIYTATGKAAE